MSNILYDQPFRKWRDRNQAAEEIARAASIRSDLFVQCFSSKSFYEDIRLEETEVEAMKITGSPTFFVGKVVKGTLDGIAIVGANPLEIYERVIDYYLSQKQD